MPMALRNSLCIGHMLLKQLHACLATHSQKQSLERNLPADSFIFAEYKLKHLISQIWLLPLTSPFPLTSSRLFLANLPTDCVRDSRTKAVLGKQHQILFKRTCNYSKMHKNGILMCI